MQEYADPVIDWLDAGRGILGHRLFRDVRLPFAETVINERHLWLISVPFTVVHSARERILHQGLDDSRGRFISGMFSGQFSNQLSRQRK